MKCTIPTLALIGSLLAAPALAQNDLSEISSLPAVQNEMSKDFEVLANTHVIARYSAIKGVAHNGSQTFVTFHESRRTWPTPVPYKIWGETKTAAEYHFADDNQTLVINGVGDIALEYGQGHIIEIRPGFAHES